MKSQSVAIVNHAKGRRKRRGLTCLFWGFGAFACMLIAGLIVIGAVYAGWHAGLATARAESTVTVEAFARQQCDRLPADLLGGSLRLAQSRLEHLANLQQTPDCLPQMASTATAVFLLSAPSPTPPPTHTPTPPLPTVASTVVPPASAPEAIAPSGDIAAGYDLDALLGEARGAMSLGDYPGAIDTLDAIISIDEDYQRELVRPLFLEALTAQALALYRSGRLSEAIVMTDRAEEHGSIEDLYHERHIALLYLDGQRYKTANPAEAVRKFSSMYHEFGVRDYVNGPIAGELQEAYRNFALALALQGDHCPAQAQFEAALDLKPAIGRVNLADLAARRDQSVLACQAQQAEAAIPEDGAPAATPESIGARPAATPAPVGHTG